MKNNLKNSTFIIPLRIDTGDRLRNVVLTTSYLLHHFDTNIIIKEVDSERRFENHALPILKRICDTRNLNHIFEEDSRSDDAFHRTKILNDMILDSSTDIVINYDIDVLLPVESYLKSVDMISDGYDLVYPYRFGNYAEKKVNLNFTVHTQQDLDNFENCEFVDKFISSGYNVNCCDDKFFYYQGQSGIGWAEYGMVQFFKRSSYIEGYLENENFVAYGPEDVERHHRWKILEYKIGRVDDVVYHLEHERTQNSHYHNPYMKHNIDLWDYLQKLTKEEIVEYYQKQEYFKERIL
jgi:hypothetical protein